MASAAKLPKNIPIPWAIDDNNTKKLEIYKFTFSLLYLGYNAVFSTQSTISGKVVVVNKASPKPLRIYPI